MTRSVFAQVVESMYQFLLWQVLPSSAGETFLLWQVLPSPAGETFLFRLIQALLEKLCYVSFGDSVISLTGSNLSNIQNFTSISSKKQFSMEKGYART
jgi:hypothetical protein